MNWHRFWIDDGDEWYPVYTLDDEDEYSVPIDLTDEEKADYDRVMAEFRRWQNRLAAVHDAAEPDLPPEPSTWWYPRG